jgi:NAD+ dependent glucose-6-phosphate dehydrogenase
MVDDATPYHVSAHDAAALLGPLRAELAALEQRARHYRERVPMRSAADEAALLAAEEAIAAARIAVTAAAGGDGGSEQEAPPRRVLITGAAGRIGRILAERLGARYDLRLMYHRTVPSEPPIADWVQVDSADVEAVAAALAGIDAVVHLAGDADVDASWESVLENNIVATYTVFEAARRAGVRRIVFASTNHVMGMADRDRRWPISADQPVRPDSLYGVSKAFGEALGRFWYDQHGIGVVCLRIGWVLPEPHDGIARWMWLSPRDCAQIVACSLDAPVGFGIFAAVSANGNRRWDITDAMVRLGYRPQDDAERYFDGR